MQLMNPIPVSLNHEKIKKSLHLSQADYAHRMRVLIESAEAMIEARAVYDVCYIDEKLDEAFTVKGVRFVSKVLRKQLEKAERIFPYVVTIGQRLEEWARSSEDLLEQFILDSIGNTALREARLYFQTQIRSKYGLKKMAGLAPGSLEDWPITEQRSLFSLLGDVEAAVGVRLTSHMLMLPSKSVSGICFPTDTFFESCQLCPREKCPGRRMAYSEKAAREHGIIV